MLSLAQILISVALLSPVIFTLPVTEDSVIDGPTSDLIEDSNRYGEAEGGQFPYHVSLRYWSYGTFTYCGGAIISAKFVLTSAHCRPMGRRDVVHVGVLSSYHDSKSYSIRRFIAHEDHSINRNDIALIETDSPIKFNKYVAPIALERSFIGGGIKAVTTGLEERHSDDGYEPLKFANLVTVSNQQCRELLKKKGHDTDVNKLDVVCAEKDGPLLFDTGAPLAANNKLIGITSWKTRIGVDKFKFSDPVGYTRISDHIDWIEQKTNSTF